MGKEPCENCGLTNYNYVRKCHSHAKLQSMRGCGKFGCDHCFRHSPNIGNGYFCPDCHGTAETTGNLVIIVVISFVSVLAFAYNGWI